MGGLFSKPKFKEPVPVRTPDRGSAEVAEAARARREAEASQRRASGGGRSETELSRGKSLGT